MIEEIKEHLSKSDYALSAYGFYFLGWTGEDVSCITEPYRVRLCETQHGSAESLYSQYFLDREEYFVSIGNDEYKLDFNDFDFLDEVCQHCELIHKSIDDKSIELNWT